MYTYLRSSVECTLQMRLAAVAAAVTCAGDVLRGVTCTNFVYPTKALFGAVPPERHIVSQHLYKQSCHRLTFNTCSICLLSITRKCCWSSLCFSNDR